MLILFLKCQFAIYLSCLVRNHFCNHDFQPDDFIGSKNRQRQVGKNRQVGQNRQVEPLPDVLPDGLLDVLPDSLPDNFLGEPTGANSLTIINPTLQSKIID